MLRPLARKRAGQQEKPNPIQPSQLPTEFFQKLKNCVGSSLLIKEVAVNIDLMRSKIILSR